MLLCLWITFYLSLVCSVTREVELNPTSTIYNQIDKISHDTEKRLVQIILKEQRRCLCPSFILRLSGKSLVTLDIKDHSFKYNPNLSLADALKPTTNIYSFTYNALDKGTYFLEIIVISCSLLDPNNFKHICLEDPSEGRNIVNKLFSFQVSNDNYESNGTSRWVSTDSKERYLATRYQRVLDDSNNLNSAESHNKYNLINSPDWTVTFRQWKYNHSVPAVVCYVGDSHSRFLHQITQGYIKGSDGIRAVYIDVKFPHQFQATSLKEHQCTHVVIALGQWPAGWTLHEPYTLQQYTTEMAGLLRKLKELQRINTNLTLTDMKIYFRTINYNSLGYHITRCPPIDWRSPPVIDMLNSATYKLITTQSTYGWIDLKHIIAPMWDSAVDWRHYHGKVFNAEAQFILYSFFNNF